MPDDVEGFRRFAAARLPALYRSAVFLCGDPHAAEDLVQESLTKVYLVWGTRRIDDPLAYTRTTMMRTFLSLRRRRSASEYPVDVLPDETVADPDVAERLDLQRVLAQLSPLDRAIVVLRYLEDQSVDDVALAVNRTPGNVRVRASRALGRMRGLLVDEPFPEREPCHE